MFFFIGNLLFKKILLCLDLMPHKVKSKTGWLEIRIMCPSGLTCHVYPWTVVSVN